MTTPATIPPTRWVIRLYGPLGQTCGYVRRVCHDGGFVQVAQARRARRFRTQPEAAAALAHIRAAVPHVLAPSVEEAEP